MYFETKDLMLLKTRFQHLIKRASLDFFNGGCSFLPEEKILDN